MSASTLNITTQEFKQIMDSIPQSLIIINKDLHVCDLNQAAEKTHVIKQKSLIECLPYLKNYTQAILNTIENKRFSIIKVEDHTLEEVAYKQIHVSPITLENEKTAIVLIEDITKQTLLEQKIFQDEKMVSLGLLTAGVVHEINNPINFILASVSPLQRNIEDLSKVLNAYHALNADQASMQLKNIEELKEELDLNYLLEETQELLKSIEDGVDRTQVIIQDLRSFSQLDSQDKKKANLQEGIDSTLSLLYHHYKNRIEIIKEYGDMPLVMCYPNKLNQVFMNILSNAMDAISDKGEIHIKTGQIDSNYVEISFRDNGCGISPNNLKTLFKPFFTTKPIGAGTGLGLYVTQEIIKNHAGTIEVKSQLNEGTEFIIKLPIN